MILEIIMIVLVWFVGLVVYWLHKIKVTLGAMIYPNMVAVYLNLLEFGFIEDTERDNLNCMLLLKDFRGDLQIIINELVDANAKKRLKKKVDALKKKAEEQNNVDMI